MKIFIAGIDGYLGWSLAQYLALRGHDIGGADNFFRRKWVKEIGSHSVIPISSIKKRKESFRAKYRKKLSFWKMDLRNYNLVENVLQKFQPDTIVHFGECPSAPYSMIDASHATFVQTNNIVTTLNLIHAMKKVCPNAHLVKLGTMGEYGTPNIDIPEGFFDIEYRGRKDTLPFPRQANSWYHWSKVHDSNNIMFACKTWNLRATDIMQGIVFGTHLDFMDEKNLFTRFDFDHIFGTSINRFCCQAIINYPITLYGKGNQQRSFLSLKDSIHCTTLVIENPPKVGEYRVFNQFQDVYNLHTLALKVKKIANKFDLKVDIENLKNPRHELDKHYYNPDRKNLVKLGYIPSTNIDYEIESMLNFLTPYKKRIESKKEIIQPKVMW